MGKMRLSHQTWAKMIKKNRPCSRWPDKPILKTLKLTSTSVMRELRDGIIQAVSNQSHAPETTKITAFLQLELTSRRMLTRNLKLRPLNLDLLPNLLSSLRFPHHSRMLIHRNCFLNSQLRISQGFSKIWSSLYKESWARRPIKVWWGKLRQLCLIKLREDKRVNDQSIL